MESKYYNKYLKYRTKYLELKNIKKLQKGGVFFAEGFIHKLREITTFLSDKTESDPQVIINEIMQVWKELIHLKTSAEMSSPTILEHYTNLNTWLYIFDEKYGDDLSRGYRELEEYERRDKMPEGCLDYKISWFGDFLTPEISIFQRPANLDDQAAIDNNERLLGEILNEIVTGMCGLPFDNKKKYRTGMSKNRLIIRISLDKRVSTALKQKIIILPFIKNFVDTQWIDYKHTDFDDILDCDNKIAELPEENLVDIYREEAIVARNRALGMQMEYN